jgi:hypothetical protein
MQYEKDLTPFYLILFKKVQVTYLSKYFSTVWKSALKSHYN